MAKAKSNEYRVVALAANYLVPRDVVLDGELKSQLIRTHAYRGDVVELIDGEAARLLELKAVKHVDDPLGYEEMKEAQLKELCVLRGVEVRGSGVNGDAVEADYVNALKNADIGANGAGNADAPGHGVGASDGSGGPVRVASGSSAGVRVDAEDPALGPIPGAVELAEPKPAQEVADEAAAEREAATKPPSRSRSRS